MDTGAVTTPVLYSNNYGYRGDWALMSSSDPGYGTCNWGPYSTVAVAGSHYGGTDNPLWWQVDLGEDYQITELEIRGTNVGSYYNGGVSLKVCSASDGSGCSDCGTSTMSTGDSWVGNVCDLTGRYVRLEKPLEGQNWHFCRVRVTGALAGTDAPTPAPTSSAAPTTSAAPTNPLTSLDVSTDTVLDTDTAPNGFDFTSVNIASGATLSATGSNPLIIRAASSANPRPPSEDGKPVHIHAHTHLF